MTEYVSVAPESEDQLLPVEDVVVVLRRDPRIKQTAACEFGSTSSEWFVVVVARAKAGNYGAYSVENGVNLVEVVMSDNSVVGKEVAHTIAAALGWRVCVEP